MIEGDGSRGIGASATRGEGYPSEGRGGGDFPDAPERVVWHHARTMDRRAWLVLSAWALLVLVGAIVQWSWTNHYDLRLRVPEEVAVRGTAGLAFVGAGLVVRRFRPESRIAWYMVAIGLLWSLIPILSAPLIDWRDLPRVAALTLLPIVLFTFPTGHLAGWERWAATGWIAVVMGGAIAGTVFSDNAGRWPTHVPGCCPSHALLIRDLPEVVRRLDQVVWIFILAIMATATLIVLRRWLLSTVAFRARVTPLGLILGPVLLVTVVIPAAGRLGPLSWELGVRENIYLESAALILLPIVITYELLHTTMSRARVGDMVRSLGDGARAEDLEAVVREALGDSTARLAFRRRDTDELLDLFGSPVSAAGRGEAITDLEGAAVLIHDQELDAELVRSVGAAISLALQNAALQSDLRTQMAELRRSRQRIVAAADDARRGVERDLHDGAQQRLVSLSLTLHEAADADASDERRLELLRLAAEEADAAIGDLRDLARGVHPAILTQAGLEPAVATLADRAPIPVDVDIERRRFTPEVEAAAYFVISEGLTNSFKHSRADRIFVAAEERQDRLHVRVADNGTGGATLSGAGLRGLQDRIEALGGHLEVAGGEHGSILSAWIPILDGEA